LHVIIWDIPGDQQWMSPMPKKLSEDSSKPPSEPTEVIICRFSGPFFVSKKR
jgi:hypothetical protein